MVTLFHRHSSDNSPHLNGFPNERAAAVFPENNTSQKTERTLKMFHELFPKPKLTDHSLVKTDSRQLLIYQTWENMIAKLKKSTFFTN